jgi:hypothetical protein
MVLVSVLAMFAFTNHVFERRPLMDTRMIGMATLQGRGDLPPLHMAMDHNVNLANDVAKLSDAPVIDVFVNSRGIDEAIASILLRWAGADQAQQQSFGPYIDARVVMFLKKAGLLPESVLPGTEIPQEQAAALTQTWFNAYDHFRTRLLAQSIGNKIYQGGVAYDLATDKMTTRGPLLPDFIRRFDVALETASNSAEAMRAFLDFIDATKGFGNLSDQDQDLIMSLDVKPKKAALPVQAEPDLPDVAPQMLGLPDPSPR